MDVWIVLGGYRVVLRWFDEGGLMKGVELKGVELKD